MASLKGMDRAERAIDKAIHNALAGRVKKFIMNDLNQRLHAQEQPNGQSFPKKAESTKKAYRRMGWNTEKFLIRTGESVRLTAAYNRRAGTQELVITPIGHDVLSYHVPDRVKWFPDYSTGAARDVIMNIFNEELRNELN